MAGHPGSVFQGIYERDLGDATLIGIDTSFMEDAPRGEVNGCGNFTLELDMFGPGFTDTGDGA